MTLKGREKPAYDAYRVGLHIPDQRLDRGDKATSSHTRRIRHRAGPRRVRSADGSAPLLPTTRRPRQLLVVVSFEQEPAWLLDRDGRLIVTVPGKVEASADELAAALTSA